MNGERVGTVGMILRFPVKSMAGEELRRARVEATGIPGDRTIAVHTVDGRLGSGKTTHRFRRIDGLRSLTATTSEDRVVIAEADGPAHDVRDPATATWLSAALGREITIAETSAVPHHDQSAVHVLTTSSLAALERSSGGYIDPRRFRPNLVIETTDPGFLESGWPGRRLALGAEVILGIGEPMVRCRMIDAPGADVRSGPRVLKTLGAIASSELGATASVIRAGSVTVGDPVLLLPAG